MNVEIEFENYNIKSPKMPDPFNVNLINAVGSGGGGGGNEVELTWAEYEALSEAEKMNGTNYFITDINTTKSLTKKTLLSPCQVTANTSYTLSDSIFNYDFIEVKMMWTSLGNGQNGTNIIFSHNFVIGDGGYYTLIPSDGRKVDFGFTSNTTLTTKGVLDVSSYSWEITGYIYQRVIVPNQMINYSTVETRIGTWIDGKPIYKITIPVTHNYTLPNSAWLHITELDTIAQDIGVIIDVKVISYEGTYNNIANYTTRIVGASFTESLPRTISFQSMRNGNDYLNSGGFIILQYTKHTD